MKPDDPVSSTRSMMPSLSRRRSSEAYAVHRMVRRRRHRRHSRPEAVAAASAAIVTGGAHRCRAPSWSKRCRRSRSSPSTASARMRWISQHAKARGVRVTNTPDVLTDDVADMALGPDPGHAAPDLRRATGCVRAGRWGIRRPCRSATKFTGKRLGILGLGRIGRAIAKRAQRLRRCRSPTRTSVAFDDRALSLRAIAGGASRATATSWSSRPPAARARKARRSRAFSRRLAPMASSSISPAGRSSTSRRWSRPCATGRLGGAGPRCVRGRAAACPKRCSDWSSVVLSAASGECHARDPCSHGKLVLDNLAAQFAGRPLLTAVV